MSKKPAGILLLLCSFLSCTSTPATQPVPSLAESLDAQASFHAIRERWILSTWDERIHLEPRLEAFRQRFESDPLSRLAEAYIALIALHRNELAKAKNFARRVGSGPAGNTRDLGTLVEGAILVRSNNPEAALQLLDPIIGKMIDPFVQDMLHEAAVAAAVKAHRWYQAVIYMNEWIHSIDGADLPAVRKRLEATLLEFPSAALEAALRSMGSEQEHQGGIWERELREIVATRVAKIALERSDPELARSVLEASHGVVEEDGLGLLARLAYFGNHTPRIVDARVGWIIETSSLTLSSRSAQAITGAIEVFKPERLFELPPNLSAEDIPQLIVRDVSDGSREDAMVALSALGVSLIVGGYDAPGATELAEYAEANSIAVVLLVAPEHVSAQSRFTFVLGEPDPTWATPDALQAVSHVDPTSSVRIAVGPPPASPFAYTCDPRPSRVGEPAFPAGMWRTQAVEMVAVDGPDRCAKQVLRDLRSVRFEPKVFLGLEARDAGETAGAHVFVAACGLLESDHDTLQAWRMLHGGNPSWFQALGRDAALLAHGAVISQPRGTFANTRDVVRIRAEVQSRLAYVQSILWTTEALGFDGERVMGRRVWWASVGDGRRK